ncbi:MAG: PAS domain-containing protein [Nitrospirae bacterium]|nr:PAS domain-containing protein [Nitrospirota bacterium]
MVRLTWFHAVLIALAGPLLGYRAELSLHAVFEKGTVLHTLAQGLIVAVFAFAASNRRFNRTWRATAVGMGLMTASAILVHLSGGYIELHFHFFVMLIFMAVYQDWVPYLVAILYVALQHGVVGVLWPHEVFNHTAAFDAPWTWAAIHAFFVLWASVGSIISWKYTESAFTQVRLVLKSVGEGIFGLNREGNIVFINSAAITMLGLEETTLLGRPIAQLIRQTKADGSPYPDDESPFLMPLRNGASYHMTDTMFWRKDGPRFAIEYRSTPIIEGDEVTGLVVTFSDITERQQADAELKTTLSLLSATVESTADGILVVNKDGKIIHCNRKFVTMWRIPDHVMACGADDEALGWVLDQLQDPEAFLKKVQDLYTAPDAESHDVLTFKDGRVFERYSQPQRIDGHSVGGSGVFETLPQRCMPKRRCICCTP